MSSGAKGRRLYGRLGKVMLLVLGFSLMLASGANAGLFLYFDGIKGESIDRNHPDWIVIDSFSWGVGLPKSTSGGGGGGASKPVFDDLSWDQAVDRSTPFLFNYITTGKYISTAKVDLTTTGSDPYTYFQMEFRDVLLTNLDLKGTKTTANIEGAFGYDFIKMTYTYQNAAGQLLPISASYNLKTGDGSVGALAALFGLGTSGPNNIPPVPLPASLFLLGSGLVGLIGLGRTSKH